MLSRMSTLWARRFPLLRSGQEGRGGAAPGICLWCPAGHASSAPRRIVPYLQRASPVCTSNLRTRRCYLSQRLKSKCWLVTDPQSPFPRMRFSMLILKWRLRFSCSNVFLDNLCKVFSSRRNSIKCAWGLIYNSDLYFCDWFPIINLPK